jgi:hypothetical protein
MEVTVASTRAIIHSLFAQYFNRAAHLDIVFLNSKQEEQLAAVCKPFTGDLSENYFPAAVAAAVGDPHGRSSAYGLAWF